MKNNIWAVKYEDNQIIGFIIQLGLDDYAIASTYFLEDNRNISGKFFELEDARKALVESYEFKKWDRIEIL